MYGITLRQKKYFMQEKDVKIDIKILLIGIKYLQNI